MTISTTNISITHLITPREQQRLLHQDIRAWLINPTESPPPPMYFYDAHGSALFDRITRLPEYYLTRAETQILEQIADDVMERVRPQELVEIGSGYSRKTRILLESMRRFGGDRYLAFDVSESAIQVAADQLTAQYPWLEITGFIGDFHRHLDQIPRGPRRLVAFLGSTIGNFDQHQRMICMRQMSNLLHKGDYLLLGIDLVKDRHILEAAYNDSKGVTAEFNRNMFRVLNRELGGNIPLDAFSYEAYYNPDLNCMEMGQRSNRNIRAYFQSLDISIEAKQGELLRTELSCKFTRASLENALATADLQITQWHTDPRHYFAVALISRA